MDMCINKGMIRCAAAALIAVIAILSFTAVSFAENRVVDLNSGAARGIKLNSAKERVIDLNSGAARGSDFVMTDEAFKSADGRDLRLTMSGLNTGNKAAMLECLSKYYSTGLEDPLKIVDESFVDAEKWDAYDDEKNYYYIDEDDCFFGYDTFQCWAGACSNLLWLSGWAKRVNDGGAYDPSTGRAFTSEDDVFDFYTSRFDDNGNDSDRAIDWFFMGQFFVNGITPHANLFGGPLKTDGLLRSFVSSAAQKKYDLVKHPEEIRQIMRTASDLPGETTSRAVFQASIGSVDGNTLTTALHSLTAAGLITDPAAAEAAAEDIESTGKTSVDPGDIYKAIILIDSDNDGEPTNEERAEKDAVKPKSEKEKYKSAHRKTRPNSYTIYRLKYNKDKTGRNYWEIVDYYPDKDTGTGKIIPQTCALYDIDALPVYDSTLEQNFTETEGTADLWTNIDLTMDSLFLTDNTTSVTDPSMTDIEYENKSTFEQGERVNLNYFLSNRSNVLLNSSYPGGNRVTVDWKVTRDEDGKTVAEGTRIHAFNIHSGGGVEVGDLISLATAKQTAKWALGSYTATLSYNRGREIKEAYYLNNIDRKAQFTIKKARKQNTLKASGKTVRISARKLRKKAKTIKRSRAIKVSSAIGKVTYDLKSVAKKKYKKYFSVNKKTGTIKVKKGLKKGTYKLKIAVTASGNNSYKSKTDKVTVKIQVR